MSPSPTYSNWLDLWPTDLTMNRDHSLTKDNLSTGFEDPEHNVWETDRHADRYVQSNMLLLFQRGIRNYHSRQIVFLLSSYEDARLRHKL